jgi:hypothetical protein
MSRKPGLSIPPPAQTPVHIADMALTVTVRQNVLLATRARVGNGRTLTSETHLLPVNSPCCKDLGPLQVASRTGGYRTLGHKHRGRASLNTITHCTGLQMPQIWGITQPPAFTETSDLLSVCA